jgi:hypothetical protein
MSGKKSVQQLGELITPIAPKAVVEWIAYFIYLRFWVEKSVRNNIQTEALGNILKSFNKRRARLA